MTHPLHADRHPRPVRRWRSTESCAVRFRFRQSPCGCLIAVKTTYMLAVKTKGSPKMAAGWANVRPATGQQGGSVTAARYCTANAGTATWSAPEVVGLAGHTQATTFQVAHYSGQCDVTNYSMIRPLTQCCAGWTGVQSRTGCVLLPLSSVLYSTKTV